MRRNSFRWLWLATVLASAALGCQVVSGLQGTVSEARQTAQALETSVQNGRDLIATGSSIAKQVGGLPLVQTAQALATQQGPRLLATSQAFATEQGPEMRQTAIAFATEQAPMRGTLEAFATQQGPGLAETIQAYATEQGPGFIGTAAAYATDIAATRGEKPENIPVVPGAVENFTSSAQTLSYITAMSLPEVQAFYEAKMPENGWTKLDEGTVATESNVVLTYGNATQEANVILAANPASPTTIVLVTVTAR